VSATGKGGEAAGGGRRSPGVLLGLVAATLGVVAVIAIASGGGPEPERRRSHETFVDDEERAFERARRSDPVTTAPVRTVYDAGARGNPEAGVLLAEEVVADPLPRRVAPIEEPAAATERTGPVPVRPVTPLTLDRDFERTATFVDFLVARREQVVADLAEARRIGDGRMMRRLEPDVVELDSAIARFTARRDDLEARMRERNAEEAAARALEEAAAPEPL
jgi:hypothetical protein